MSEQLDSNHIAVCLNTYYKGWEEIYGPRDPKDTVGIRGDEALTFMRTSPFPIYVADWKSSDEFRRNANDIFQQKSGQMLERVTPYQNDGFQLATIAAREITDPDYIIFSQPEKNSLIPFIPQIVRPLVEGKAELVVVSRDKVLFEKSAPDYMYRIEQKGIQVERQLLENFGLLKRDDPFIDLWFGVIACRSNEEMLKLLGEKYRFQENPTGEKWSGPRQYLVDDGPSSMYNFLILRLLQLTQKDGKPRVTGVEVPFEYPPIIKENETRVSQEAKRIIQGQRQIVETAAFLFQYGEFPSPFILTEQISL